MSVTMDALNQCKSDFSNVISKWLPGQRGGQSKANISKNGPPATGYQQVLVTVSGNGRVRLTSQSFLDHAINIDMSLECTTTSDSYMFSCPVQILLPPGFCKDDIVISSDESSSLSVDKRTRLPSENKTQLIDINIDSTAKNSNMIAETWKTCDEKIDKEAKTEQYTFVTHTQGAENHTDIDIPDNEMLDNTDLTEGAQKRKGHHRNSSDYMSVSNRSKVTDSCLTNVIGRRIADNNSQSFDECDGLLSLEDNTVVKAESITNRFGMEHSLNDLNQQSPTPPQNARTSASSNETVTTRTLPGGQTQEKTSISVNMKQSIQKGYTKLLDELDVMDLCDHLYERAVVDFKFYSTMFELHFSRRNVRDISRYMLLHLSRISVCKDRMIDALYGSAEYRFIPVFFPEEKIEALLIFIFIADCDIYLR